MKIAQFSMKDVLLGIAVVAIGLTLISLAVRMPNTYVWQRGISSGLVGGGSVIVGQGVGVPLKEPNWLWKPVFAVTLIAAQALIYFR